MRWVGGGWGCEGWRKRGRRENGGKSAMVVGRIDAPVYRSVVSHQKPDAVLYWT